MAKPSELLRVKKTILIKKNGLIGEFHYIMSILLKKKMIV